MLHVFCFYGDFTNLILSLRNPLRMLINFRDTILIFGKCRPFKTKHLQRAHFQHYGWSFSTSDFSVYSHNGEIKSTDKYLLLENYSNISARMSVWYFTTEISYAHWTRLSFAICILKEKSKNYNQNSLFLGLHHTIYLEQKQTLCYHSYAVTMIQRRKDYIKTKGITGYS